MRFPVFARRRVTSLGWLLAAALAIPLTAQSATEFDHQHSLFSAVLKNHVKHGFVDYQALQDNQADLSAYEQTLASVSADQIAGWSEPQQIAFWINAYNAFTLRAIIDNYPIKRGSFKGIFGPSNSILQIPGVWKELEWQAAGQSITLDAIEHEILRVEYDEPRIHFAIVCASISCPDLRDEAFVPERLDTQLSEQLQVFINNPDKGVAVDPGDEEVSVSKIFDWFGEDFAVAANDDNLFTDRSRKKAGVLRYLVRHYPEGEALDYLRANDFDVEYLDYDWNLNDQADLK